MKPLPLLLTALMLSGCGHTATTLETPAGWKVTRSDTQFLRERSIGAAGLKIDDKGNVDVSLTDSKSSSQGAADALRALADTIEKAK
jgi:hypothetical protein